MIEDNGYVEFKCVWSEKNSVTSRTEHTELTFDELVEQFRAFALAMGYHYSIVNDFVDGPPTTVAEVEPEPEPKKKRK